MRRQKCAQCGTMLDISKLEAGSKFACASCGAILVVGEATAVKKSFKESGPAFTPKTKAEAPPPAPARRREERAERTARRGEETGKKSRLPLFIGAGVVVVGAIVAIAFSSGGGGGPGGTAGQTAAQWWVQQQPRLGSASADVGVERGAAQRARHRELRRHRAEGAGIVPGEDLAALGELGRFVGLALARGLRAGGEGEREAGQGEAGERELVHGVLGRAVGKGQAMVEVVASTMRSLAVPK